ALRQPARTIPNTDVNPYGANFFLAREVEPWKVERTLQMAADAGIGWVKQHFPWEDIEPRRKGEFLEPTTKTDSWLKYDRIVEACERYGLEIVARLDRPPDWTRQDNTYKQRPPDDFADYGDFVYAFVKHYQGRIHYIQIWNEPNIFPEWGNQPVNPAQYVELLKVAYRRAKEADPNVYVLSAPLAYTLGQPHPEPGKWISMSDLQFLEEMYKAGAKDYFDILSANAFGMDRPPEDPPDPAVLNFQRVVLQRRIMERYGDREKAIWFNEYGWNAAPASFPPEKLIWGRVSEQQQAEYTVRGIELARRQWPWAGVFMIWYFRQVGNIPPERADYYFRMVDPAFVPRPLYFAVQDATRRLGVAQPGLHQETSPAVKRYGRWWNAIDRHALGRGYFWSDVPGASLTLTFDGVGVDLITRKGPRAGRLLVSLDGRSVPGLPTNAQGQSYIDLYSPFAQERVRLSLVRRLHPGDHVLRLTVAEAHHPNATGRICALDAFEVLAEEERPFPLVPLLAVLLGLALDGWLLWRTWRRVRWALRAP
ncbi:MAG: hypothetical protein J7M05_14540, partial [Anaerolineae bacterium]|nr:hypothetical protein [Anaerolineae bacterium]